jgi:3-hydroxybutyrate dehydrogenase
MKAGKGGCVIHLTSIAAQRPTMVTPLYQASKAGLSMFIRGMATLDSISGIRVVGVAPG